ncbi:hemicentin-1-like [Mytilus californianus]|uniref:hemicentin-1-like n=1 Tax=Mytilus californianus TaxID=6549 RepID=UPI00224681F4|nr:hemicentin-1-like [Mytilus californianus]
MKTVRFLALVLLKISVGSATTTVADPIVKMYTEGEMAYLTCSVEFEETMEILSINYTNGACSHCKTYGVRNLCNGKTECSFEVSNSNIGSSCGANGRATLEVKYNCIRNGGWSDWNTSASCPVACGGGIRNVTRTCSNPYPNAIGSTCTGEAFDEQTCNTYNCIDQTSACLNATVNWNCPNGHIEVNKAIWEASRSCGVGYNSFISHNVIKLMKTTCDNKTTCSFVANDHNFGVSCSTSTSRCTIFEYVYTCIKATWDDWSTWSEYTRSCGSGIQTRRRKCLNQMNTTDGYISECEGIGTGSRSCNIEPCPYCNDNTFQYTSTQSSLDLKADKSSDNMFLLNWTYTQLINPAS